MGKRYVYLSLHFICDDSFYFSLLVSPLKVFTTLMCGPEGVSLPIGWCVELSTLNYFFITAFEINDLLESWPMDVSRSVCRCDTPVSSSKAPSSSVLMSLWDRAS